MEEEKNVFYGKTQEEAESNAIIELKLPREDLVFTVLEEGKKKLFGSTKWKIKAEEKKSDASRAAAFVEGLLEIMRVTGKCSVVSEDESIKLEIVTEESSKIIGKRGEVLDALQCMAGAYANIGREEYIKLVLDCQNYREKREEALVALAHKVEQKAIETGRKVVLEPMNPYERRIIHSTLVGSEKVKTSSEGKEPRRYVVVIPEGADPTERGIRFGERRREQRPERGGRGRFDRRRPRGNGEDRPYRDRGERFERGSSSRSSGGAKRAKKEIFFGTYLGNSNSAKSEESEEKKEDE